MKSQTTSTPSEPSNAEDLRSQLAGLIQERALQRGEFTLTSGQKSTYYIDGKLITFDAHGASLVAELILEQLADVNFAAIGGLDMGATPMASAVAMRSYERGQPVAGFTVRKAEKAHGTAKRIEGPMPPSPCRVVIVDDVVTTGGSILQAFEVLRQRGDEVVQTISIVDREGGAATLLEEHGVPYMPLLRPVDLGLR